MPAEFFPLRDVRLLDGPFKAAQEANGRWLLSLDADRLLAGFREQAGLPAKARSYGGWEKMSIAGHSLGHHLSACAMSYAATEDERFRQRVDYIAKELAECQEANGDGYIAATPEGKRVYAEVSRGDIRSQGFDLNGAWVPWYTMHKIFAGLRDAHQYAGNAQALEAWKKLGDWALRVTDGLDEERIQTMLACEHGGMNEVAADLYAVTDDERYLELARRFNHRAILEPLANRQDILPGKHANTQVPKLIGAARQYELTGDQRLGEAARFFWDTVVRHHSYVTGGNSNGEHFGPPDELSKRLGDQTTETCNTHNMLKLTRHLFQWEPAAKLMDYYERALLNHILASQDRKTGRVCYFVPLRTGGRKSFQSPDDAFTCCVGTGMENHTRYGESIYARSDESLWVNLFIASELRWPQKGLKVRQETQFPFEDSTRLRFTTEAPTRLAVKLRFPGWAEQAEVRVNGEPVEAAGAPGSYLTIDRTWSDGDRLELRLPMSVRLEAMPDDEDMIAVLKGPVVLAGEIEETADLAFIPALVTEKQRIAANLRAAEGTLVYQSQGIARPKDMKFVPFFDKADGPYGVYWDTFTEEEWTEHEAKYRRDQQARAEMVARTLDYFAPGEMQPERDHDLRSEHSAVGDLGGRKWRHASGEGFFEFTMKVSPDRPCELVCTYWGNDGGDRQFDILIDGTKLVTEQLAAKQPGAFYDETYAIPAEMTTRRHQVRIRFRPAPGKVAGGLFGCRTVTAKPE